MDKSRVKKSILIVILAIILYGLLWISLVGLATLIFNTISHNKTNWFLNTNLFVKKKYVLKQDFYATK